MNALEQLRSSTVVTPELKAHFSFWSQPLADAIEQDAEPLSRPLMVALAGPPSCGKGMYAEFLKQSLNERDCPTVHVSLSDFYLSRHARERLAATIHPLLLYRGPPGTYDGQQLYRVLQTLRDADFKQALRVPVFDTLFDVRASFSNWQIIERPPKIVLVSGWALGAISQDSRAVAQPINDLERIEDPNATWRDAVNRAIRTDIQPLYPLFDRWVYRKPGSMDAVMNWIAADNHRWLDQLRARELTPDRQQLRCVEVMGPVCERATRISLDLVASKSDYLITLDDQRRVTSFSRQRGTH